MTTSTEQHFSFASVKSAATVTDVVYPRGLVGNFTLQVKGDAVDRFVVEGSLVAGTINSIAADDSTFAVGAFGGKVGQDGRLCLTIAGGVGCSTVQLRSEQQCGSIVEHRGGKLDFSGDFPPMGTVGLSLYCVIAAADTDDDEEAGDYTHPRDSFFAFLMGTHPRSESVVVRLKGAQGLRMLIHSFIKMCPDWSELERKVGAASLHKVTTSAWSSNPDYVQGGEHPRNIREYHNVEFSSPNAMVMHYRKFLELKAAEEDYESEMISPPMIPDATCANKYGAWLENRRLVDEVWHLHIAMDVYEEDCRLLTNGYIIKHSPVLGEEAFELYKHTYSLLHERFEDEELDTLFWPDPFLFEEMESAFEDYGCG